MSPSYRRSPSSRRAGQNTSPITRTPNLHVRSSVWLRTGPASATRGQSSQYSAQTTNPRRMHLRLSIKTYSRKLTHIVWEPSNTPLLPSTPTAPRSPPNYWLEDVNLPLDAATFLWYG